MYRYANNSLMADCSVKVGGSRHYARLMRSVNKPGAVFKVPDLSATIDISILAEDNWAWKRSRWPTAR